MVYRLDQKSLPAESSSRSQPPHGLEVEFVSNINTSSDLTVTHTQHYYIIENGIYNFRVRKSMEFDQPTPLNLVPHWCAGMRVAHTESWDGKAFFTGNSLVQGVTVEVIEQGPVFCDLSVTYHFTSSETHGHIQTLPLMLGKESFRYPIAENGLPSVSLAKQTHYYQAHMRFVVGDPWIEVVERFRLPDDQQEHGYQIHWGPTNDQVPHGLIGSHPDEHIAIDTAFWVRWFLYDQFGGNVDQQYVPAVPRADQKGRPFARLRPRWNQSGGGAQDFFLTSGGPKPLSKRDMERTLSKTLSERKKQLKKSRDKEHPQNLASTNRTNEPSPLTRLNDFQRRFDQLRKNKQATTEDWRTLAQGLNIDFPNHSDYHPDNPAVGIVATFASKWVNPYQNTLKLLYRKNQRRVYFPLRAGASNNSSDGPTSSRWYAARSYAINIGPRKHFTWLNDLVRRHTDWTLTALINKYILHWQRDPAAVAPNITLSREKLPPCGKHFRLIKPLPTESTYNKRS